MRGAIDNLNKSKHIHVPILIFHGDKDQMIPDWHTMALYRNIPTKNKQYVLVHGADHYNVPETGGESIYWSHIKSFTAGLKDIHNKKQAPSVYPEFFS